MTVNDKQLSLAIHEENGSRVRQVRKTTQSASTFQRLNLNHGTKPISYTPAPLAKLAVASLPLLLPQS